MSVLWWALFLLGVGISLALGIVIGLKIGRWNLNRVFAWRPAPTCTGCFIDWFQFHHDIRSDCPVHGSQVEFWARDGGMIRLDGERWYGP